MTVVQAVLGFAVVAGLLTIVPGVDTALVLRTAITRGGRTAVVTGLGICTGALIWGAAAAIGAAALLAASEIAYRVLTYAGAAYIVYLGVVLVVQSFRRRGETVPVHEVRPASGIRAYATGVTTNLLNPKVGIFYVATIPQFVPDHTVPVLMGLLLAAVHAAMGMAWFAAIIVGVGFFRTWLATPRVARTIDRITGVVLVGFGMRLALTPTH